MNTAGYIAIRQRQQLDRIAAFVAEHAPHQLPLYRAARDGVINLIHPERTGKIPRHILEQTLRPVVVVIGDDDYASTGPDAWLCAMRLRAWGRFALIHGAGGEAEHYAAAVMASLQYKRLIMVETDSVHRDDWVRHFHATMPWSGIFTKGDDPHPRMPSKGEQN